MNIHFIKFESIKGAWVDPSSYIKESYPWPQSLSTVSQLRQISAEDVGLESDPPDEYETQDPLVSYIMMKFIENRSL